jgi:hypothetical protein
LGSVQVFAHSKESLLLQRQRFYFASTVDWPVHHLCLFLGSVGLRIVIGVAPVLPGLVGRFCGCFFGATYKPS